MNSDVLAAEPLSSFSELILASGSPRRRELLGGLGVTFRVVTADIDELSAFTDPAQVARDLAEQKARAVAAREPHSLILASDTLVALDGMLLGKPRDVQQNAEHLRHLSGRTHSVFSGVALLGPNGLESGVEQTDVTFRPLSESEISYYARSGEGLDKAGGYGIQGLGMALVSRIEGDYSSVVGFPLSLVMRLLRAAGVPVWGQS
ncbi:Maf family nucleotide pyrophosphatase [Deinococcus sp. KNUC1210]|uniref:Maf family nucleotide pyrophosphatase n=1 Tax=Deinococcus sp. KNUC1210 TaxID=2917691 RepID=UPI001EF14321|nr:Maf family nucleotide pyrophosphatase [Deinococcus sp. KNUC1210]ULH15384.1 Maf family nucleotide pyrophosphatase [Deinococcus sp. KNUC1210]